MRRKECDERQQNHSFADSLHQSLQVFSNSFGVGAHVASAHPRHRAHVDTAALVRRGNANDNVIFEAEPEGRVSSLDTSLSRV